MGTTTYKYSSGAFTSAKSTAKGPGGRKYNQSLGQRSVYERSAGIGLQDIPVAAGSEQRFEATIEESGQFCLISDFNTVDGNGFLYDVATEFIIYTDETSIALVLEEMQEGQMTIINEIIPYSYSGAGEGNELIELLYNGYNGLLSPSITIGEDSFLGLFDYYTYTVVLNTQEASGLQDRFGSSSGQDATQIINSSISTAAAEVINSYQSKRMIYNRVPSEKVDPHAYRVSVQINAESSADSADSAATTTSGGGY